MKQAAMLLVAALAGAAIALGAVALEDEDSPATETAPAEVRVIAEGRFEEASRQMFETYRELFQRELPGVDIPSIEGPEPCVGIGDETLRALCIEGLKETP